MRFGLLRRVCGALLLLAAAAVHPHDVAGELRVHAIAQAEDGRLQVVLRLPLELLLNVDLPKRGNGYLDLARFPDAAPRALAATVRGVRFLADGEPLEPSRSEARIALPSDKSFATLESARAAVSGSRLPDSTDVFWNQGWFDALIEYRLPRTGAELALQFDLAPGLRDRLRMDLRVQLPGGAARAFDLRPGTDPVLLDPGPLQAAASFTRSGVAHILGGADHLLFLVCLVLPFRRIGWPLVGVVTAFTVAHSVTLVAAALGQVPGDAAFPLLVEWLIAVSILVMAAENLFAPRLAGRWLIAALFGLVHGFGFSFGLAEELQFAGSHLMLSLLAFNLGVEIGQLLVLALLFPLLAWGMPRLSHRRQSIAVALVCAFVAHLAWHWAAERFDALSRADLSGFATLWPQGLAALLLAAAALFTWHALRRPAAAPASRGHAD